MDNKNKMNGVNSLFWLKKTAHKYFVKSCEHNPLKF